MSNEMNEASVSEDVNVYVCYDKTAKRCFCCFEAQNDGLAVRENAPGLSKIVPIGDLQMFQIATLNPRTMDLNPCGPRLVDWECYKFPENPFSKKESLPRVVVDGANLK